MPRPQFSLKTMLWLMVGTAFLSMADWPTTIGFVSLLIGGAIVGGCVGAVFGRPVWFAVFGLFYVYPLMTLAYVALVITGVLKFD